MRLLLVENDGMIAEPILEAMCRVGYAIDWAVDECEAELSLNNGAYDLVLLDLDSSKQGGIDTLNSYRKAGGMAPVVILTARDAMGDHTRCLDSGTEDYLFSTFDLDELIAKVRALTRRRIGQKQPVYAHGELTLDPTAHEAMKNGVLLSLAPTEFALLQALIEQPTRVFRRSELEEKLHGQGEEVDSDNVEARVLSLRRKIGLEQVMIIRGVGYRLKRLG